MALNGWTPPSRPCSGPAIASLPHGAQLLVQGCVLSSGPCLAAGCDGNLRRTLLLRLDDVELLQQPAGAEAAVRTGGEPAAKRQAAAPAELSVDVDTAGASAALASWLAVKGARRLLVQGVGVEVGGRLIAGSDGGVVLRASSLRLVAALPEPAFVARVLRLPALGALVCADAAASGATATVGLAAALQPCTVARCAALRAEINVSPSASAFKNKALLELCAEMRDAQGWSSAKGLKRAADGARPPKARTWEAVLRMEERWNPDGARFRAGYGCGEEVAEGAEAGSGLVDSGGSAGGAGADAGGVARGGGRPRAAAAADGGWLLGSAEPMLHMPVGEQTRSKSLSRRDYVIERKRPQVLWMLGLLRLLGKRRLEQRRARGGEGGGEVLRLVDVGGGRGDLALAIGACLGDSLGGVDVHVLVLDINPQSLEQGEARAAVISTQFRWILNIKYHLNVEFTPDLFDYILKEFWRKQEAGLLKKKQQQQQQQQQQQEGEEGGGGGLEFMACNVADQAAVSRCLASGADSGGIDIVTGLHCCGGLSEAALALALDHNAGWAVCSCCFASHPTLATLGATADTLAGTGAEADGGVAVDGVAGHRADRLLACGLAQATQFSGQSRAQRAVNSSRLGACHARFDAIHAGVGVVRLESWLLEFPKSYSLQNSVLVGEVNDT